MDLRFGVLATAATDDVKTTFFVRACAQEVSTFRVPFTAGSINCACHVAPLLLEDKPSPPRAPNLPLYSQ